MLCLFYLLCATVESTLYTFCATVESTLYTFCATACLARPRRALGRPGPAASYLHTFWPAAGGNGIGGGGGAPVVWIPTGWEAADGGPVPLSATTANS